MTYGQQGTATPPGAPAGAVATVPPQAPPPGPRGGPGGSGAEPPRRTAWAEGVDRLRAAATTEPGRLRIIGAVLAVLVIAFGAVTAWETADRSAAADDVLHSSQPLSADAADIYRSLADANTAASSGFLAGGQETAASRTTYEADIRVAADKLVTAAANSEPGSTSQKSVTKLNKMLPEYKGLVERARANNRQGYPLGGAYLRYANSKMQVMLAEAERLYTVENQRLRSDYDDATPYPWIAIGAGVLAIGGLGWAQLRNYRRTNRVLNHGLAAATAATTVVVLWLVVGHTVARAGLNESYDHGVRSLNTLNDARIASLKARGNENLTLVARGAETKEVGKDNTVVDVYDYDFERQMKDLTVKLAAAAELADDRAGVKPVEAATGNMKVWKERHKEARAQDTLGNYQGALDKIIGSRADEPTGECFEGVDTNLEAALKHERAEFERAAGDGRSAMNGLVVGAAVLAGLAAGGALLGIGRRLSEYR
ncbi:hypothetical protein QFZ75_005018 [Streptomyces sp. V3I8]|uniref:hypothetical protein n=1 Tax=Streptomyces sp. V3I8 TaxID=3042279 RepID=UPI00278127B8|nr:hypothetical protein [Streptomyces sp. V3I8]MDQ1038602.1 hypothetical protein [Streptomyces sp. V3I8]